VIITKREAPAEGLVTKVTKPSRDKEKYRNLTTIGSKQAGSHQLLSLSSRTKVVTGIPVLTEGKKEGHKEIRGHLRVAFLNKDNYVEVCSHI
jgi:hypothetical protein